MKITDIAAALQKAATDMQAFAARNDDLNLPDQLVLPFIMNFLTDETLRKLSSHPGRCISKVTIRRDGGRSRHPANARGREDERANSC
jgi:hypothetical protein